MKENPDRKKANSTLQEHLNALSLVYIYQDTLLDYDKIIDTYASKYPRKMLLINPLNVIMVNVDFTKLNYREININVSKSYTQK